MAARDGAPETPATRWLILGASGFLGRHVREAVAALPGVVRVVSACRVPPRDTEGEWARIDLVGGDRPALAALLDEVRPHVVVNATGVSAAGRAAMVAANVGTVAGLLDALEGAAVRLVHLGSAAEYGPPVTVGLPVDEDTPTRPVSVYGALKLAATRLALEAAEPVEPVVLRVFNPVGSGMSDVGLPGRAARAIHEALQAGRDEVTLGPLGAFRDFVDARDVARAVVAAGTAPGAGRQVVNVGSGQATLARDLVATIADVAGYHGRVVEAESAASSRSGGVEWQAADIRRAAAVLGWAPTYPLRSSVEALWASVAG